nr:ribonuclease H-like domain-containing protein [Tanacetum cinerariifolium]
MDVKSAFLYEKIEEEVYVCQTPGFEDLDFPDKVYKVEKALYRLHQAPKAWFTKVKTASTPMQTQKPLLKDKDGEEVDVHMYRSMISLLMYLTSSRPDFMFAVLKRSTKIEPLVSKRFSFDLVAYTDSDYAGASLDRKSTTKDGKEIVITESSVRRDLQLVYGEDEAVHKELGDSLVRAAITTSSLGAEQDNGNINKTQSKATPNESSSQETNLDGGPGCQETIWDNIAQTEIENVSKQSNDSLLARGNTLQSDKDRLKLDELMALCTNLQNKVLNLKQTKTTQHNEIASLKRKVKKLENKNRSRTHRLKRLYKVSLTARVESFDNEESLGNDASKQERIDAIDADEEITMVFAAEQEVISAATTTTATITTVDDITLAQALMEIKSIKPKEKRIVIQELIKDQIRLDEETALNLQAEFDEEERLLVEGKEKRAGTELIQEITKRQKVEDNKETAELKQLMRIIQDEEEVAIDAIPLAVKSPIIVDWKIYKEGRKNDYQIIRAVESLK